MPIITVTTNATRAVVKSSDALVPADVPSLVSYTHTQSIASDEWIINHNLAFRPNVTIIDSGGNMVEGAITHTTANSLTITLSAAISGTAYLS